MSTVLRLAPLGKALTGHTGMLMWGAWAAVAGLPVLATGGTDGAVRLWDPSTQAPLGEPLTGHPTCTVGRMRDHDVRVALWTRLLEEHAEQLDHTLLVDELGLCGEARVDVAVINGSLTGYELKSARDKLDRLPNQVSTYGKVLDYAYLVVARAHLDKARSMLPPWWGILVARGGTDYITLRHCRKARKNPGVDAASLVQLLWRDEALAVLTRHGQDFGVRTKPRDVLWARLALVLELDQLRDEVRETLRARRGWRESPAQHGSAVTWQLSDTTPHFLARRLR